MGNKNVEKQNLKKKKIDEDKPKREPKIFASLGPMCWATDENGVVWWRWSFEKWQRAKKD